MFCLVAPIITCLLCGGPQPQSPNQPKERTTHATVDVRTDAGWVGPSQVFNVIVAITPDTGWHVYWKNPGASGAPTEIEINAPDGFTVGKPVFPRPTLFQDEEGTTYGYANTAAIFVPITAPKTLQDGEVELGVSTQWLACKKSCVMGDKQTRLLISTNKKTQGPLNKDMQLPRWRNHLPKPLGNLDSNCCIVSDNTLYISGKTLLRPIQFIGVEQVGIQFGSVPPPAWDGDHFLLSIPLIIDGTAVNKKRTAIEGLLMLGNKSGPSYVIQTAIETTQPKGE